MKYEEVVRYIEDIPKFTKKHTLLHTREFMRRLGNPCQGRKVLHVAGTNGKGSVCAYMQAILLFEGKRVGFFTSPHLVKLNERIRINGKDIDDDTFCRIFAKVRQVAEELEKEGLVTIEPRKGAYASDISIKEMIDVLEVRQYLESLAAGMAAARITPEEKLKLQEATDAYKQAIESEDTSEIIKWDENFHKIIVDCSGNKTLIQMISQVQELALRFRYIYYDDFSRYKNQPLEHQEIEEAIMNGNVEKARKEANEHLARLKEFVMLQGEKIVKGGQ